MGQVSLPFPSVSSSQKPLPALHFTFCNCTLNTAGMRTDKVSRSANSQEISAAIVLQMSVRRLTPWSSAISAKEWLPVIHRVNSVRWWRSCVSGRFRTMLDAHELQYQRCVPDAVKPRFCRVLAQTEQCFFHEIRLPSCLIIWLSPIRTRVSAG